MAARAREMLFREKKLLVTLKLLLQRFRGDVLWAPLGDSETAQDQFLLDSDDQESHNGLDARTDHSIKSVVSVASNAEQDVEQMIKNDVELDTKTEGPSLDADAKALNGIQSVDMAVVLPNGNDVHTEDSEVNVGEHDSRDTNGTVNGTDGVQSAEAMDIDNPDETEQVEVSADVQADADEDEDDQPVHAMTTRAKARTPPSGEHSPPSISDDTLSATSINGFFLPPDASLPDRDYGLPTSEAEDTRRMLILYVQKQEEIVRGTERLMHRLLEADRKRKDVWRWCKAEGHINDMSDGEDWYDKEEWGLTADLIKGKEEEDVEDEAQRKVRRRRENTRKPQTGSTGRD